MMLAESELKKIIKEVFKIKFSRKKSKEEKEKLIKDLFKIIGLKNDDTTY